MEYGKKPLCEICGRRPAKFVCKDCGRVVCEEHFDPILWVCTDCKQRYFEYYPAKTIPTPTHIRASHIWKPMVIFMIGVLLLFIGFIFITFPGKGPIYVFTPFPLPGGYLSLVFIIIYFIIIIAIFIIFLKEFWGRALS